MSTPNLSIDVVALALIEGQLHVLAIQRTEPPYQGMKALPGGLVLPGQDENLEQTARRVLKAKTGFAPSYLEQLQTFGSGTRDPRSWTVSVVFVTLVPHPEDIPLGASVTAEDPSWQPVEALLDGRELAFDHTDILRCAVERVRSKTSYSSLAAYLLPVMFTLSELQHTYEAILGRTLDKSVFRQKVREAGMLAEVTGSWRLSAGRPAQLYRVKPELTLTPKLF